MRKISIAVCLIAAVCVLDLVQARIIQDTGRNDAFIEDDFEEDFFETEIEQNTGGNIARGSGSIRQETGRNDARGSGSIRQETGRNKARGNGGGSIEQDTGRNEARGNGRGSIKQNTGGNVASTNGNGSIRQNTGGNVASTNGGGSIRQNTGGNIATGSSISQRTGGNRAETRTRRPDPEDDFDIEQITGENEAFTLNGGILIQEDDLLDGTENQLYVLVKLVPGYVTTVYPDGKIVRKRVKKVTREIPSFLDF